MPAATRCIDLKVLKTVCRKLPQTAAVLESSRSGPLVVELGLVRPPLCSLALVSRDCAQTAVDGVAC
jgi:hypothetical protein